MPDTRVICTEVLSKLRYPVFLAREVTDGRRQLVEVHTATPRLRKAIHRSVSDGFARAGVSAQCRVIAHKPAALRRARSLEVLNKRFRTGVTVFDPTGFVSRSEAVVDCGARVRRILGERVAAVYLEAKRRTLFVVLDRDAYGDETASGSPAMAETLRDVASAVTEWRGACSGAFQLAFRVGFQPPRGAELVSVDSKSAPFRDGRGRKRFRGAVAAGLAALFGATTATTAAAQSSEPAVSGANFSAEGRGGVVDGDGFGGAALKATLPLGHSFGAQVEGAVGTDDYYGGAGHLFWRDPQLGLFGVIGSYETYRDVDLGRAGAEAELYLDSITIGARGGYEFSDADDGFWGRMDIGYYITDDLEVHAGFEATPNTTFGRVGTEWQLATESLPGLSVFGDVEFGEDDTSGFAGVRWYFGTDSKSLIDRKRRDDPGLGVFNTYVLAEIIRQQLQAAGYLGTGDGGPPDNVMNQ